MLIYKTFATPAASSEASKVSFQGSQTEASKARAQLKRDGFKAESQTIEVPTNKAGLLAWLNENVTA
jgi:hypothetical protein